MNISNFLPANINFKSSIPKTNKTALAMTLPCDSIILKKPDLNECSFETFKNTMENVYGNTPLEDILDEITSDESNKIGEGSTKTVYEIKGTDYVVGKIKGKEREKGAAIKPEENYLTKYNFARPIANNGSDLIVMKKVNGKSHSIPDYGIRYYGLVNGTKPITRDDALQFMGQLDKIKDYPIESFIDMAEKMAYLSDNGFKADNINPNNILVDEETKSFNIIDLFPDKLQFILKKNMQGGLNSVQDMINITTDAIMQPEYVKVLSPEEQAKLKADTIKVIKKCLFAGKFTNLRQDDTNTIKAYHISDEIESSMRGNKKGLEERYLKFKEMYKDYLP